ncbi:MAG: hypothetical protein LOY01_06650 [Brachybacterium paraconglomeratum]|nr:hypothetical protein [Brachybacterium paraconglomeratum]
MSSIASVTTRRALMKGVAWAAPVAAVAITAPALAASPPVGPSPVIAVLNTNASCKVTGGIHKYRLVFTFTNSGSDAMVKMTSVSVTPNSGSPVTFPVSDEASFSLPAGVEEVVTYESDKAGNMANGTAVATFEYEDATGVVQAVTQEFAVPSLRPC